MLSEHDSLCMQARSPSIVLPQAFLASRLTSSFSSGVGLEGKGNPSRTPSRAGPLWARAVWSIPLPCFWPGYLFPGSLCSSPPEGSSFLEPCKLQRIVGHLTIYRERPSKCALAPVILPGVSLSSV